MAGPLARLYATFGLDARGFESGANVVRKTVDRLGGTAAAIGTMTGAAAGAMGAAALGIADDYKDATDTIRIGTGATGAALADLESQFRAVGGRVPDDMGMVSQVIADLNTRTGQTGEGLGKLAEQILDLSRLTGTDASTNVANLTRLYGDWSIATEDQAAANDELFRASQASGIAIDKLSEQVVQFGAPLRNIGFEFEDAIALLAKWEKEGVNTTLSLGGLKIALGEFAKEGVDAKEGLADLVDQIVNADTAAEAMALGVRKFGSRAGPDMVAAIREGRFATEDLVEVIKNGGDTIAGLSDETRDAGDAFAELKNQVALAVGPIVKDLGGIGDALGSAVYLLPALGGALGRGLGLMWTKAGGGTAVKAAIAAAGAAAGVIYDGAAFAASRFIGAATALWALIGSPGKGVIAAAAAAGAKAGAAYAGATSGGGLLGAAALAVRSAAPLAIPAAIAIGAKPILDEQVQDLDIGQTSKDIITGDYFTKNAPKQGQWKWPWEGGGFFHQDGEDLAETVATDLSEGFRASNAMVTLPKTIGDAIGDGWQETGRAINAMATLPGLAGVITKPIQSEFSKAVAAVRQGFGSVKQALASPPRLISREDRVSNMAKRIEKAMGELHKAVKAKDPVNIAYWTAAVQTQQRRMERMKGKAVGTNADIRQEFKKTGVSVDGTWLGVEKSVRSHSNKAKGAAVGAMQGAKSTIAGMDLSSAGRSLMGSLVSGIRSMYSTIRSAGATAASMIAQYFESHSPPKVGPLRTIDRDGASLMDVWLGGISSRRSRVAATGRAIAGAFAPRAGMGALAAAGTGGDGGGTVHFHIGTLIADEAGLDELDRRMSKRRNRTTRGRRLPSERPR